MFPLKKSRLGGLLIACLVLWYRLFFEMYFCLEIIKIIIVLIF